MLLEIIADREIAEFRRVAVPADGVAARPVAGRHGADVERHLDAVAGVEARAADLGELPERPEIARAHFGIGLEAAGGEHHAFRLHLDGMPLVLDAHGLDAVVVGDQRQRACAVSDGDVVFARDLGELIDQARPAAPGFDGKPAPELELAVDLVGLAAPDRHEAHALVVHPQHGFLAAGDQNLAQVGIGAVFGNAAHVVEEFLLRVGAEVGFGDFLVGQVRHQPAQVLDPVIDAAERAGGEAAVAAGFLFRRALQHEHGDTLLGGGECCAKRRIAGADDDHIRRGR